MSAQNAIVNVLVASAQSVAKVFVIGAVGYFSVLYPKQSPLLPVGSVGTVARFTFQSLTLPLIFATTAQSVSPGTVADYWFVLVGAFGTMALSHLTATALLCIPYFSFLRTNPHYQNQMVACRIAATYNNIVALPILIFPSLCEYPVVYEAFGGGVAAAADTSSSSQQQAQCNAVSNTMIFAYFFVWSLMFWSFGNPQLMEAAARTHQEEKDIIAAAAAAAESVAFETAAAAATHADVDTQQRQPLPISTTTLNAEECVKTTLTSDHQPASETAICVPSPIHLIPDCEMGTVVVAYKEDDGNSNNQCCDGTEAKGVETNERTSRSTDGTEPSIAIKGERSEENQDSVTSDESSAALPVALPTDNANAAQQSAVCEGEQKQGMDRNDTAHRWSKERVLIGLKHHLNAVQQVLTSPGFVAMALGFITGCIPPLQKALFETASPLRFLGSSLETLGQASSSVSTMVVAASLVPMAVSPKQQQQHDIAMTTRANQTRTSPQEEEESYGEDHHNRYDHDHASGTLSVVVYNENPIMSDPSFGPQQIRQRRQRRSSLEQFRRNSARVLQQILVPQQQQQDPLEPQQASQSTKYQLRLLLWFTLARLVLSPAIVVAAIIGLDCGGCLAGVPNLSKLVVIINASLPGALIVVVVLKSRGEECAGTAQAVASVYLPTYLLSIITIAAWTAIGLLVSIPDEDGFTFCDRRF